MGVEWFGHGHGAGIRAVVRVLVHRFSRRAAGDGGRFHDGGTPHAAIAAFPKMFFPFLVILPGMIAIGAHRQQRTETRAGASGSA